MRSLSFATDAHPERVGENAERLKFPCEYWRERKMRHHTRKLRVFKKFKKHLQQDPTIPLLYWPKRN